MTTNANGFDEALGEQLVSKIENKGLKVELLEAGGIPWPNIGTVLCVNLVPVFHGVGEREAIKLFIVEILAYVSLKRFSQNFSAIQIGISKRDYSNEKLSFKRVARYFVDSEKLRLLESGQIRVDANMLDHIGNWT